MLKRRLEARLREKKERLDALRPLPPAAVAKLRQQLAIEWTYNTNAIEGSTLTLRETQLILEEGLTIGGRSLREHFEVVNHQEAIELVQALADSTERITQAHVRDLHRLVLAKIDDDSAGQDRQTAVRIAGAAHEPPPAWKVGGLMGDWAAWLGAQTAQMEPIALAALAQHRLLAIHPFIDGNGRTARLLMNLILMRAGYPPAVIARANRRGYYSVLAQADAGKPAPLVNFVGRAVERSLTLYLAALTPQKKAPPAESGLISLNELAAAGPYGQAYLSLLARTGRLDAIKKGRTWHASRLALKRYLDSLS